MSQSETRPVKPLILNIHTEPDGTFFGHLDAQPWRGFELGTKLLSEVRGRVEERTGHPAHFSWQFRADSQVAEAYGSSGWAFDNYANQIDALTRAGDEIGLHQHGYRWDADTDAWIEDYGDQAWMEEVVTLGFEAFRSAFGGPPESFTAGVTWTNTALIRLAERLGARYDLSLAPRRDKPFPTALGAFTGDLPDTSQIPLHPYRPAVSDFRLPDRDREDGIWIIPLTTGRQSAGGTIKRNFRRVIGGLARHEFVTKLYLQLPIEYLAPVFNVRGAAHGPSHFTLDIRSDAFRTPKNRRAVRRNLDYLTSPERPWRPVFMTPAEAIAHYLAATETVAREAARSGQRPSSLQAE